MHTSVIANPLPLPEVSEALWHTHLAVELDGGLSFELVSREVGVVRGLDVVVGQGMLQIVDVHRGLLQLRHKVILIHQKPGVTANHTARSED